ncbi:hypothetical protein ACFOY8_13370 [Thalassospira xianhensis]|uniref:Uncharacterized protein n=1 Tax=Thalassospira xianhensis MCCC 1A02616 TaxID=1177929 RepID=A0A367UIG3_9PROT|nr:hypothetical protein [Thalassospira xianhensis]RCK07820.1 hypothetical protein TH5_01920 [Thalassospira xianhensis MCCC 1A02616]
MQALLYIALFLIVLSQIDYRKQDDFTAQQEVADAIVLQMMAYHSSAVRYCANNACGSGPVPTVTGMSGTSWAYGDEIKSVSNGTGIVVTVFDPFEKQNGTEARFKFGPTAASLRAHTRGSMNAGQWQAASQQISAGTISNNSWAGSGTPITGNIAIPQGFGGLTLADQQPILATRVN